MTTHQQTVFDDFLATLDEPYIALAYQTLTHLQLAKTSLPESHEEWCRLVNPDEDDTINDQDDGEYYL